MMKRILRLWLSLVLLLGLSAFAQEKRGTAAQATPATTDQKPEAAVSEEEQAEAALQKAMQNPASQESLENLTGGSPG